MLIKRRMAERPVRDLQERKAGQMTLDLSSHSGSTINFTLAASGKRKVPGRLACSSGYIYFVLLAVKRESRKGTTRLSSVTKCGFGFYMADLRQDESVYLRKER